MSKKADKKDETKRPVNPALQKVSRVLEFPGMLGWFGTVFGAASLWFLISSLLLNSAATGLDEGAPDALDEEAAHAAAEGARSLGFGDRALRPVLRARVIGKKGKPVPSIPMPFRGETRKRVQMAVAANGRASWVFGLHTLFVALFLWGLRLFEPSIKAEHVPVPQKAG
jgi:hypothetical protein